MNKENIALQLYSVREDMKEDFLGTLKKVKEMGYKGVEFAGLFDYEASEVKKMCEEAGVVPISAHVPLDEFLTDLEGTVETYHEIGCKYVAIPYLTEEYRPGHDGFQIVIDTAKKIGEALKKYDMVLMYHNHDFEFVKLDGKYALDILYEEVRPELLQTELDTCWVNVGGENPVDYLNKYAGRCPVVHLKDFAGSKSENMYALIGIDEDEKKDTSGQFEFRALGKGVQKFPEIIDAAIAGNAEWFVVEQDCPSLGCSALECAKISVDYLKEILK